MIGLIRLHHVSFAVSDLDDSRHFFSEVLGLSEIQRPGFQYPGAWYALGDRQLHLIQETNGGGDATGPASRSDHMALEVSEIDAVKTRLAEHGIEFGEGGNEKLGMSQVFCRDPDGHIIEFVSYRTG